MHGLIHLLPSFRIMADDDWSDCYIVTSLEMPHGLTISYSILLISFRIRVLKNSLLNFGTITQSIFGHPGRLYLLTNQTNLNSSTTSARAVYVVYVASYFQLYSRPAMRVPHESSMQVYAGGIVRSMDTTSVAAHGGPDREKCPRI